LENKLTTVLDFMGQIWCENCKTVTFMCKSRQNYILYVTQCLCV